MDEPETTAEIPSETGIGTEYKVGYKKPPLETRFKPGNAANPTGKNGLHLTSLMREVLESGTIGGKPLPKGQAVADVFAVVFVREALKGKFSFAKEMLDRIDGKVPDRIQLEEVRKAYDVDNSPDSL